MTLDILTTGWSYWPIAAFAFTLIAGIVIGWMLSTRTLRKDARDGHAVYLGDTAYRLIPVDLEHEYEIEQRRQYGTMAEQSW